MKKNKQGSALLCILLVMNIVLPALVTIVIVGNFVFEQYKDHTAYTKNKNASESLLNYALSLCCHHFDDFKKELKTNDEIAQEGLIFEIEQWPSGNNKEENDKGKIIIKLHGSNLLITSILYANNQLNSFCASCILSKNKQQQYVIKNWQSHIQKE